MFVRHAQEDLAAGGRVLVLAHREELLEQARKAFERVGVWAAVEQGTQRAGSAPVVIASVATLRGKRLKAFASTTFAKIIVDEGHHAAADSYRNILEHFPTAKVLIVTATPDRSDGRALKAVCHSVAYRYELRRAIAEGWLTPLRAQRVLVDNIDLSGVTVRAGDFAVDELSAAFNDERSLHGVAVPLLKLSGERRTIAFCVDVAHAHALAATLNQYAPGVARAVDGTAERSERKEILAAFRRGEFRILVNCALYTEGFDEPLIACVAIVRPTKSRSLHCQMLGRGTRLCGACVACVRPMTFDAHGNANRCIGKRDTLVLDFVGNSGKHSLAGPVDALAPGDVDADLRAEIERLLELEDRDALTLVEQAQEAVVERRKQAAIAAVVDYRTKEVDPFLANYMPPAPHAQGDMRPATAAQRSRLEAVGLAKLPATLTLVEASRWLTAIERRHTSDAPTFKQARHLERQHINTEGMTRKRADELMQLVFACQHDHKRLSREPEYRRPA